jgi:hypothetical protein
MTEYTVIGHSGENWTLTAFAEHDDELQRNCVGTFGKSVAALESPARVSAPLPAVYQTVYSAEYRGYSVHVAHRPTVEALDGSYIVRSMYMGLVMVGESPVYLDYMKPSGSKSGGMHWRNLADAIGNVKWFVKTQLPKKDLLLP